MIKKALLTLTLFGTLAAPLAAQPDLPAPKAGPQGEVRKTVQRPLYLSPDGKLVAVIEYSVTRTDDETQFDPAGSQVSLWEVATGRRIWRQTSPANTLKGSFSQDGSRFLCFGFSVRWEKKQQSERKTFVHLWNTTTGESLPSPELIENEDLQDLVFSPEGKQLAGKLFYTGKLETNDFYARLIGKVWDANTGKLLRIIRDRPELTREGHWKTQGNRLLTNGNRVGGGKVDVTNKVSIWSWPELELVAQTEVAGNFVMHKALAPDGSQVAFTFVPFPGASDGIHLWNVASKEQSIMNEREAYRSSPASLAFLSDSKTLVTTGLVYQNAKHVAVIHFWDSETGEEIRRVIPERSFAMDEDMSYHIQPLPGDKQYVVVSPHGLPELRSLEDGTLIRSFEAKE